MDILLLMLIVILVSKVVILVTMAMTAVQMLAEVAPEKRLVPPTVEKKATCLNYHFGVEVPLLLQ
jgi:hypothetical protein